LFFPAYKKFIIPLWIQISMNILSRHDHQSEIPAAAGPFSPVRKKTGITAGACPAIMNLGHRNTPLLKLPYIRSGEIQDQARPLPPDVLREEITEFRPHGVTTRPYAGPQNHAHLGGV
jgi:hypothetical protein